MLALAPHLHPHCRRPPGLLPSGFCCPSLILEPRANARLLLQGHLSAAQGGVLHEMQQELLARGRAQAAAEAQAAGYQREAAALQGTLSAKLSSEQRERERLNLEAAQSRLLCTARGRQISVLQEEGQQLKAALAEANQHGASSTQHYEAEMNRLQVRPLSGALAGLGPLRTEVSASSAVLCACPLPFHCTTRSLPALQQHRVLVLL